MKRVFAVVLALTFLLSLAACGSGSTAATDTASGKGYTVKIVAVHKTVDSYGAPMAAVELEFTNENSDPVSLMFAASIEVFQNGKEMVADEMYLENDFDWDSFDTQIKDGATITAFVPKPLDNAEDPVEVKVGLFDPSSHFGIATAQVEMNLVD